MWKWRENMYWIIHVWWTSCTSWRPVNFFDKGCIVPRFHQTIQHEKWPDIWRGEDEFILKLNFQPETSSKINQGKEKSSLKPQAEAGLFLSEVDLRASQRLKIQLRDEFILTEFNIWSLWMLYWLMEPGNNTPLCQKNSLASSWYSLFTRHV